MTQAPLKILVVDDAANIRKTLSVYLESEGHAVVGVSNFQDALVEARRRPFDLAFVDLRLGAQDGLDLIPGLLAAAPGLKIVVITADGLDRHGRRGRPPGRDRLHPQAVHAGPDRAGCP
jgi:DNA-binding response OmpR family regulator